MWTSTATLMLLFGVAAPPPPAAPASLVALQNAPAQDGADALDAAFVALQDKFDAEYNVWRRAYSEASAKWRTERETNPEAKFDGPEPVQPVFFPQFDRMAQAGHGDAALWCLQNYSVELTPEEASRDYTLRALNYMAMPSADLAGLTRTVGRYSSGRGPIDQRTSRSLLNILETVALDPEVRASAAYTVARMAGAEMEDDANARKARVDASRAVAAAYPDTRSGKRAAGYVFSEEHLQIGMVAPEVMGADVDGNPMRLTDFRGKVTVVDFWGFW